MNKIRIFLSSRVSSSFAGLDQAYTLTELRQYIRESLEAETLLGEKVFDVITNETSFNGDFSKNAFDNCLDTMRSCHMILIFYSGEAGWSPVGTTANGICHEELMVAINDFSGMTWAMDLTKYFRLPEEGPEKYKNEAFKRDIELSFRHIEKISVPATVEDLKRIILKQTKGFILNAVEKSFETRKAEVLDSNVFGETLDWSKRTYSERQSDMQDVLKSTFSSIRPFIKILKSFHAIPDNMSVADARNMIGRPFIEEHELIKSRKEKSGVIHFVAVYGNATEIQVKNLVGYPDLTVIKSTFGYYLWEKNAHIQMFFFTKCINPQTFRTRLSQLINWLNGSGEQSKIIVRAKARFTILHAINEAEKMEGLK